LHDVATPQSDSFAAVARCANASVQHRLRGAATFLQKASA